jgi:twitching motility two-component system response regulator PilG
MDKKRILIAEDDESVLKVTKRRLEFEGYDVVTATDGEAALHEAAGELPIHLILLDIKLPKRSGYDVCQTLKQQPATAQIPVIVFSASESVLQQMANRCIRAGAADWIRKPFETRELLEKIQHALGEEG